jgi:hypothetical protein
MSVMPIGGGHIHYLALGGCLVDDENPNWKCKACEHEW